MIMTATAAPDSTTTTVPAYSLTKSKRNVRRTNLGRNIKALAKSIFREGLYQNLVVTRDGDLYPVEAGERRRQAIAWLVKKQKLPRDWPVPVRIVDVANSTIASVTENVHREQMHPADEFAAFHDLTKQGWTIDEIADLFGVTPLVVERRLSLAGAAPELIKLFRADEINQEQLMALCSTDSHERQVSVWRTTPSWNRDARNLRSAVMSGEVEASSDSRIAFIGGVDAFLAAGGEVRRDLFSGDGHGSLITDAGLLEQLVVQKLEAAAAEVRAEGWGWVEVWREWNWTEYHRFGRIPKTATDLSPEAQSRLDALQAEHSELSTESDAITDGVDDFDELSGTQNERYEAVWARLAEIDDEIRSVRLAHEAFDPQAVAAAGAAVGLDRGTLRIERGLVRIADREKVARTVGANGISGGRTTEVAGRKPGALSDSLTRSLFGYRNLAAQSATARNPQVAKVLLACWMVVSLRTRTHSVPVDLRIAEMGFGTRTQHPIADEGGEAKRKAFDSIGEALVASLPKDEDALWDALMQFPPDELDRLIAFAVASSVSLSRSHTGLTAKLLNALGFDMADHFTPTAANFLGRVSKALIIDALTEAGKVPDDVQRAMLTALKKPDLAARAESELATSRWVPSVIRTPLPDPAAEERAKGKTPRRRGGGTSSTRRKGKSPAATPTEKQKTKKAAQPVATGTLARPAKGARAKSPRIGTPSAPSIGEAPEADTPSPTESSTPRKKKKAEKIEDANPEEPAPGDGAPRPTRRARVRTPRRGARSEPAHAAPQPADIEPASTEQLAAA